MKADQRTITLLILITIDCVFGGLLVGNAITNKLSTNKLIKEDVSRDNLLAMNEVFINTTEDVESDMAIVYETYTMDELARRLDSVLSDDLSGKGYLIASYSLSKGVDPYLAASIMMHETGCKWGCSRITKACNNVGGQKGSGCGSYKYYETLDEGIMGMIDNLYNKYISLGLLTPETINPKYAEDTKWSYYVNRYIETFKQL